MQLAITTTQKPFFLPGSTCFIYFYLFYFFYIYFYFFLKDPIFFYSQSPLRLLGGHRRSYLF